MEQVSAAAKEPGVRQGHVPGHLLHPSLVGGGSQAGDADLAGADSHERQHVVGEEPRGRPNFGGEEIHGGQDLGVGSNKLSPGSLPLAFRSRQEAVTFEDIGNGLMTEFVPQVFQSPHNPAVAPTSILASHLEDQFLDGLNCLRATGGRAHLGSIEFVGDQLAVPGQDGFGTNDLRHFLKSLPSEALALISGQKTGGQLKQSKEQNLLDRLDGYDDLILAFLWAWELPFTNNEAERDFRFMKTRVKISGCFRTLEALNGTSASVPTSAT